MAIWGLAKSGNATAELMTAFGDHVASPAVCSRLAAGDSAAIAVAFATAKVLTGLPSSGMLYEPLPLIMYTPLAQTTIVIIGACR